ncbi:tetratricopeptide repeat protein [Streptomyces sp. NPDC002838]|uniref:tetratricopeptide repeat protein n=1 Tax=Streptomyces sp. NPDC002838 TaxID=3154436 RepID=UPI00331D51F6
MEFDRRVQVRVRKPGADTRGFGSGYLVAPHLVLTAAHVVEGASETEPDAVTVSRPDSGEREFAATVRWQRKDEKVDAALVEVDDGHGWEIPESLVDLLSRPPQRWGRLIGTRPHRVTLAGFPRMQKDPTDGRRLDEHLTGHIAPGTGLLASRYEVSSTDPTLAALPAGSGGSRWSGMSGAAVLSDDVYDGDVLCGVTCRDRQARGGTRLIATPAALLLADHGFRELITAHTGWEPVLEAVEPAGLLTPAASERDLHSPAALLRADAAVVTFQGREDELAQLRAWCEGDPATVSVQVLTGPGGQGKTRLARHLTDTLGREGWATGHLRPDLTDHEPSPDFTALATPLPLLLVVDYAETRPRLLRRLITHLHRSQHRVRLLVLARSDGEWRTDPLNAPAGTRGLLKAAQVIELAPLIPDSRPQDRITAFTRAARDIARLLSRVPSLPAHDWASLADALRPIDDLGHGHYNNALTLQLTALVTLLQQGPTPVETSADTPAEEILLEHEERFWEDSAAAPAFKLNLPTPTLAAAVAAAALCGATSKDEARCVIGEIPDLPAEKMTRTAAWLAQLYPAERGRYWGSLQPDRIAEFHAARTLIRGDISLPALLEAAAPGQQAQLIIVMARAAVAHYNSGRITESEHLLRVVDAALDTASTTRQTVSTVLAALPHPTRVIASLALRLGAGLAHSDRQLAEGNPAQEPNLATSLSNLGTYLATVGRWDEAISATDEAVALYRRLAAGNPAAHEPDLATALSNLSIYCMELGRRDDALGAAQQAVEIRRRLAAANPAAHEPQLAASLTNLGTYLAELGRRVEALAYSEEAVEILRRLAAGNPAAHEPALATALSALSTHLKDLGRLNDALGAEQQALKVRRHLATANPAAHEANLARSLSNLGTYLAGLGRADDALDAEQQAAEIRHRLAAANPAAHEPDLAASLTNLSTHLAGQGRRAEALAASESAVALYRRLAADHPAAHEPDLAASLNNLGIRLSAVGQGDEALASSDEAIALYRRLAAGNPHAHEPDLATSLSAWAEVRINAQQNLSGALRATGESVEIYRRLVAVAPARFGPRLRMVLRNQADLLLLCGRLREAREIRKWLAANASVLGKGA